jgi:hypothetical protein
LWKIHFAYLVKRKFTVACYIMDSSRSRINIIVRGRSCIKMNRHCIVTATLVVIIMFIFMPAKPNFSHQIWCLTIFVGLAHKNVGICSVHFLQSNNILDQQTCVATILWQNIKTFISNKRKRNSAYNKRLNMVLHRKKIDNNFSDYLA